jgi:hypothetical protein
MKLRLALLSLIVVGTIVASMPAAAKQAAAVKKETKWQGTVVRIYKDSSKMDIRGGANPSKDLRTVVFDSSTEWTNSGKPGQRDEVKEGSFVIVLGHIGEDGALHATRVDLRKPR